MSIPVYRRVAFDLKHKILSGQYPPGTLLPPEKELQALYQVSRTTVRRAVSQLVEGNYVTVRQGYGTEVTDKHQPMGFHKFHNVTEITERFAPGYDRARTETALFRVDSVPAPSEAAPIAPPLPQQSISTTIVPGISRSSRSRSRTERLEPSESSRKLMPPE